MTRNSIIFSTAILAVVAGPPVTVAAVADELRLAQATTPPSEGKPEQPGQHPPGQRPPGQRPPARSNPNQQAPAATPPGRPGPATAQPATPPQRPATPGTAQTPPNQQHPNTPAVVQTPPNQSPRGAPPAAAQNPPGQARPGTPAVVQTPPNQHPGAPPAAQLPPGQARPGGPAVVQVPNQGPRPGAPPAVLANVPIDPRAMPQHLDQLRGERRETREGDRTVIQEGNRLIVREGDHDFIRHDEADRFRFNAREVNVERRGDLTVTVAVRPDGSRIITEVDASGRLVRRIRRDPLGREEILIDNAFEPRGPGFAGYFVDLPPPVVGIPRDVYIREANRASAEDIYLTLMAPPIERIGRRYALDEIRYSEPLRERMPRVDIDTVNFESGSWEVTADQVDRLAVVAEGILRAVQRNPREVFLIEGYTDATGNDIDNLSLSDRRAESVALVLTNQFRVPPENLTTQGYGKQFLKVPTSASERANRRVAVRRITPLLLGQSG